MLIIISSITLDVVMDIDPPPPKILNRLLTPADGCGISKAPNKRIVGGAPARIGTWPWIALIFHKTQNGSPLSVCGW